MEAERRFEVLATIMRASHFQWRRAALALNPGLDPGELVNRYWDEVGRDTASYYLRQIDADGDVAEQVAALFVSSSVVMGEEAEVIENSADGRCQVRHHSCPWFDWHQRENLLAEDLAGCDHFLQVVVKAINSALGTSLRVSTVESLPGGGGGCLRQFWEERE
ncbi:MAG: hypothetical protein ABIF77_16345 [bacterium]